MSQLERQNQILKILDSLSEGGSVSVKELSAMLFASTSSVRRDVISLEKRGLVSHMYGGVVSTKYRNSVVPVSVRGGENSEAKEYIAAKAVELVKDGDVLILDSSSTARRMLPHLRPRRNLKIVTNNALILSEVVELDAEVYCTGGRFDPKNNNFLGSNAEEYIRGISADICFFSCQGLSEDGEITDVSNEEIAMRRVMLSRSKRQVFLCDASKVGVRKFATLCRLADISDVICDKPELIERVRAL